MGPFIENVSPNDPDVYTAPSNAGIDEAGLDPAWKTKFKQLQVAGTDDAGYDSTWKARTREADETIIDAADAGTTWTASNPVDAGGSTSGLTAPPDIEINPRRNELNNYSSYTYNIALYMLIPKEYVKIIYTYKPKDEQ